MSKLGCKITAKSRSYWTLSKFFFQHVKDRHLLFFVIKWHENSVVNPKLFFFIRILIRIHNLKLRIRIRIRILLKGTVSQNLIDTKNTIEKWKSKPGLWIRIVSIRIRIQHFSSIRIWIHKIIESGSNANPDSQQNFWRQIFVPSVLEKNRVVDPDPDCIRIQWLCGSGSALGIRIQRQENEEK